MTYPLQERLYFSLLVHGVIKNDVRDSNHAQGCDGVFTGISWAKWKLRKDLDRILKEQQKAHLVCVLLRLSLCMLAYGRDLIAEFVFGFKTLI